MRIDQDRQRAFLSPALRKRLRIEDAATEEQVLANLRQCLHPEDLRNVTAGIAAAKPREIVNFDLRILDQHGITSWWQVSGYRREDGVFIAFSIDVSQRKHSERLLRIQRDALDMLAHGAQPAELISAMVRAIKELDPELLLLCFEPDSKDSPTLRYVGGSALGEAQRRGVNAIDLGDTGFVSAERAVESALKALALDAIRMQPLVDGSDQLVAFLAFARSREQQATTIVPRWISIICDVMLAAWEQWSKERRIIDLAYYDPLTGLGNRRYIDEIVSRVLAQSTGAQRYAVMVLDLDGFKPVNDVFGHDAGDQLLCRLTDRMLALLPRNGELCRQGGDEFVMFVPVDDAEAATRFAEQIADALRTSVDIAGAPISVSGSIGFALYPDDASSLSSLFRAADLAMYEVKRLTKNGVMRYRSSFGQDAVKRYEFLSRFKTALDNDQLELFFQPQVNLADGTILGAECLLRWHDTDGRLVSPGEDIAVFEASDIMTIVDRWVVTAACQQIAIWNGEGLPSRPLSINLSPQRLGSPDFIGQFIGLTEEFGIAPDQIRIEVTESAALSQGRHVPASIAQLRDAGFDVLVDDFGTRFSHLAALLELPIAGLKLDRSLINGVSDSPRRQGIIDSVRVLADRLNLDLVAEGVENLDDLAVLHGLGINKAQGFLFSAGIDAAAYARMISAPDGYQRAYRQVLAEAANRSSKAGSPKPGPARRGHGHG
ncbi:MAG: EAL domain-containing protein [Azospirillaceae bacterium]